MYVVAVECRSKPDHTVHLPAIALRTSRRFPSPLFTFSLTLVSFARLLFTSMKRQLDLCISLSTL